MDVSHRFVLEDKISFLYQNHIYLSLPTVLFCIALISPKWHCRLSSGLQCKGHYVSIETTCRLHDFILCKLQKEAAVVSTAAMGHSFSWFLVGQKMWIHFSLIRLYFRSRFITHRITKISLQCLGKQQLFTVKSQINISYDVTVKKTELVISASLLRGNEAGLHIKYQKFTFRI